jgi:hypothetical protein
VPDGIDEINRLSDHWSKLTAIQAGLLIDHAASAKAASNRRSLLPTFRESRGSNKSAGNHEGAP